MDVNGKTVLLTGGSAGIGREIARQLKAKGANVILTGRDPARLEAMRGEGFEALAADLSHAAGVDALAAALGDRPIDILINNAGQGVAHDFREGMPDPQAADDCIYATLNAPIRLITTLLPRLRARPQAAIINVTSGLAIAPRAGSPVYCATKAALRSYTLALRAQLAGERIQVIEALPPVVDTQMTADRPRGKMPPQECARQIIAAIEGGKPEANVGLTKVLRAVYSLSPALARQVMIRF
ncbi:SDR family NAD(P)-dependent oxidoreductase [Erythrobacter sp. sf7]|uniref:SDR family NAD(P)-dependent oxidoreductase n=1 Tax=Erythrobacter fulvus TaxID=2987523 RepID=A0ABT5JKI2_9SPHN|nr:SDR family NAD(P)-dependent oxidoreductase [Erythrobacter fulvus]MDC8753064.1 SDR family NAD(P)-dependent oxidoreductase [Erythrobacter fulvus]